MLTKLEFLTKASHQLVEEWLAIVDDDVWRHTISINDMFSNKIDNILLLDFF